MKPVVELHWPAPGLAVWSDFNPAVRCDCSSAAALVAGGWILFDPLPLAAEPWEELLSMAPVSAIALTSGNHQRDSLDLKDRFGVLIHAPESAKGSIEADVWHPEGSLVDGFRLIPLPGGGPGESAWCNTKVLVLGDSITNLGEPALLPAKYCSNSRLLQKSIERLADIPFDLAVLAHGLPLQGVQARQAILRFAAS